MEGGCSSFNTPDSARKASELESLQKQHEENMLRIQELKKQKEEVKLCLEKKKKEGREGGMEAFRNLTEKYNSLRDEYNALLAEKSQELKD